MLTHNEIVVALEGLIRLCDTSLNKFAVSFVADPVSAFRWSNDAQQAAALKNEASAALAALKPTTNPEPQQRVAYLVDFLRREIAHAARYGTTNSSSPMANLMAQYRLMAMQQIVDLIEGNL